MVAPSCVVCHACDGALCHFGNHVVLCPACIALGHWADYGIDERQAKSVSMGWGIDAGSEDDA
jgi:hypothetical protein